MEGLNSSQGDTGDTLGADAESSGPDATLVKRPRSAPRSSNNFAASTWPFSHAIDSAVRPLGSRGPTFAGQADKALLVSYRPLAHLSFDFLSAGARPQS